MEFFKTRQAAAACAGIAATLLAGSAAAQVSFSKHNMGILGAPVDQVCVYCHTPHGAADPTVTANQGAPLWNRVLDPTRVYDRYSSLGTATLDGTEAPVGSVSLACLSCHDGQQARDVVINAPGAGNRDAAGVPINGVSSVLGPLTGVPVPDLGTDLRDDHPISIQYAGGACQGATADCDPTGAASGDPDFEIAQYALINGKDSFWVDTSAGTSDIREKSDMILYARSDFAAPVTGVGPSVECGSCHDPHDNQIRPVQFMRVDNAQSNVCLACHIK